MQGVEDVDRAVQELSRPGRLTAALNWYRANHNIYAFVDGGRVAPVTCPSMGIWSTRDFACGEQQMVDSAEFVDAPWRYERIDGASHWIPPASPKRSTTYWGVPLATTSSCASWWRILSRSSAKWVTS